MRLVAAFILLVATILGAGCNIVGPAAAVLSGPPQRDAEYILPDVPTVVFVDDRGNTIGSNARTLRKEIADKVSADLMEKKVLATTILPRDAMGVVAAHDREGDLLPIDAIGREVGADQVIYVEMIAFQGSSDGMSPQPYAACRVRVIDVNARQRLFPDDEAVSASRALDVTMRPLDPAAYRTSSSRLKVSRALADLLGERIAKLFYKHEIKELGGQLDPN
jgi:hypothetical protein